jgi:pyrroloquinoline quinone biosynthesis protein B
VRVIVLGAAAGGGFPQWNCNCNNCRRLRQGTLRGRSRSQVQVAISHDHRRWHLVGASPDLGRQIETTPCLHPREALRDSPIASITLTCAEADQVLGLLLLREMHRFTVYATPSVCDILCHDNSLFRVLERAPGQVVWVPVAPGDRFEPEPGLAFELIPLPGSYPGYVPAERVARCRAVEAVTGVAIQSEGRRMLYVPGLPAIDDALIERMEASELVLVDGTFWADDELSRYWPGARRAHEMGHLPLSGAGGSLERLAPLDRPRKVFIHVNNTNPILDEEGPEYDCLRARGWEVAFDGMTMSV